jgi:hypothetical protein
LGWAAGVSDDDLVELGADDLGDLRDNASNAAAFSVWYALDGTKRETGPCPLSEKLCQFMCQGHLRCSRYVRYIRLRLDLQTPLK